MMVISKPREALAITAGFLKIDLLFASETLVEKMMNLFKLLNITIIGTIKLLTLAVFLCHFNFANAKIVRVEDMGLFDWDEIENNLPGFGSSDSVTLNWNPDDDFFTELLAYNSGYSGRAGAYCWYQKDCALELSVSAENHKVTLESFFLGDYYPEGESVVYSVLDLDTDSIITSGTPWVGSDGAIIAVNATSNVGFRILFGDDGIDAGINDIAYSYSLVPIPAAAWFFGSGLIGLICFARTKT